jgi:hypothetical protein
MAPMLCWISRARGQQSCFGGNPLSSRGTALAISWVIKSQNKSTNNFLRAVDWVNFEMECLHPRGKACELADIIAWRDWRVKSCEGWVDLGGWRGVKFQFQVRGESAVRFRTAWAASEARSLHSPDHRLMIELHSKLWPNFGGHRNCGLTSVDTAVLKVGHNFERLVLIGAPFFSLASWAGGCWWSGAKPSLRH